MLGFSQNVIKILAKANKIRTSLFPELKPGATLINFLKTCVTSVSKVLSCPYKIQDFYNLFLKGGRLPSHKALKFFLNQDDSEI